MGETAKLYRIFIASPGDVVDERKILKEIVDELGQNLRDTEWRIELLGWEDTMPGMGRPQDRINEDLDKADLFIGCLWERWGSESGLSKMTGFEEEFTRTKDRWDRTRQPEIWQFFRQIPKSRSSDPGPQLKRVLDFRTELQYAKYLLYREYADTADWRKQIASLLFRNLLKLVSSKKSTGTEPASGGDQISNSATIPNADSQRLKISGNSLKGLTSLVPLLEGAASKVKNHELGLFAESKLLKPEENARLLLFASANYELTTQRITLGVHEINSIYWHRNSIQPTPWEKFLLHKTILLDSSNSKPGWFWVRNIKITTWVRNFSQYTLDPESRKRAVELADKLGIHIPRSESKKGVSLVGVINDSDEGVQAAGLEYLLNHNKSGDLKFLQKLVADGSKEISFKAGRVARIIRFKNDPNAELKSIVAESFLVDELMAERIRPSIKDVSTENLLSAYKHLGGVMKVFCASELNQRKAITKEMAEEMVQHDILRIREFGYDAMLIGGQQITPDQVRFSFFRGLFGSFSVEPDWAHGNLDSVLFKVLNAYSEPSLWKIVKDKNENSAIALKVLFEREPVSVLCEIRSLLTSEFEYVSESKTKGGSDVKSLADLLSGRPRLDISEGAKNDLIDASIEILSLNPQKSDRELFLKYLPCDASFFRRRLFCLKGLLFAGSSVDAGLIFQVVNSKERTVEAVATAVYLALAPNLNVAVDEVLASLSEERVWGAVLFMLKEGKRLKESILDELLRHENEMIRRWGCLYVSIAFPKKEIEPLLSAYLTGGTYYYNVVCLLDRTLYAPAPLRKYWIEEESKTFLKWGSNGLADFDLRPVRRK